MVSEDDEHDDEASGVDAEEAERSTSPVEERVGSGETDGDSASAADDEATEPDAGADDGGSEPSVSPVVDRLGSGRNGDSEADTEESTADSDESTADDEWTDDGGESEPADDSDESEPADESDGSGPWAENEETDEGEVSQKSGSILAAVASFLLPGLGHFINGDNKRGAYIFLEWITWVVLGWGVIVFLLGSLFTLVTLGFGFFVQMFMAVIVGIVDLLIHFVAGIDAYQRSEMVDKATGKVDELR